MKRFVATITTLVLACGLWACSEEPTESPTVGGQLSKPMGVAVVEGSLTTTSATIAWQPVENATGYDYRLLQSATMVASGNTDQPTIEVAGLEKNTTYRFEVRALGNEIEWKHSQWNSSLEFTTLRREPGEGTGVDAVVAKDGSGNYMKVQDALDKIPKNSSVPYVIYIKEGTYKEKLSIDKDKDNVILMGDGADKTILSWDGYQGNGESVYCTLYIRGKDVTVMDMTIENTHQNNTGSGDQAQAVQVHYGDRVAFYDCNITGYQDTFWGRSNESRVYAYNCYVEGNVDFIYGASAMLFEKCQINVNRDKAAITAPATAASAAYGIVFRECDVTTDEVGFDGKAISSIYLGRAWHNASKSVWLRCQMPKALHPDGWMANMSEDVDDTKKIFAEWGCTYADSNASDLSKRKNGGRELTEEEANKYSREDIFAAKANPAANFDSDWLPTTEKPYINLNN